MTFSFLTTSHNCYTLLSIYLLRDLSEISRGEGGGKQGNFSQLIFKELVGSFFSTFQFTIRTKKFGVKSFYFNLLSMRLKLAMFYIAF